MFSVYRCFEFWVRWAHVSNQADVRAFLLVKSLLYESAVYTVVFERLHFVALYRELVGPWPSRPDTLLNVFLAIAVDNLASAQELTAAEEEAEVEEDKVSGTLTLAAGGPEPEHWALDHLLHTPGIPRG